MKIWGQIKVATFIIFVAACCAGCLDDGGSAYNYEPDPTVTTPGKYVPRAAVVDALWELGDEPNEDAETIANSTFSFDGNNAMKILRNLEATDYNTTDVIIVESIQLEIAGTCLPFESHSVPGETECKRYIISASEEAPIDIDLNEALEGKVNLVSKSGTTPKAYPSYGCSIEAHFEKHGTPPPPPALIPNPEQEEEEQAEENKDGTELSSDASDYSAEVAGEKVPLVPTLKLVIDKHSCGELVSVAQPNPYSPPIKP